MRLPSPLFGGEGSRLVSRVQRALCEACARSAGSALAGPLGGYPEVFVVLAGAAVVAAALAVGTLPRRAD